MLDNYKWVITNYKCLLYIGTINRWRFLAIM